MIVFFKFSGAILLLLMMVVMYRMIKGPTAIDRLVAVNLIGTKAVVVLIMMGLVFDRLEMFIDISIGYGLLNFIASIAAAKFYQKYKTLHPEAQWEIEGGSK